VTARVAAGNGHHIRAQELSAKAAALACEGQRKRAHKLFADAAELERKAFEAVPKERVRTRGILAVSTASLLYKGRRLKEVRKFLCAVLASGNGVLAAQEAQLRELLEVVWKGGTP
jgi:hypothetical protein